MELTRIYDLLGTEISGQMADIRSRNADGSLLYEHQTEPRIVRMKDVAIRTQKGEKWLYWAWEKNHSVIPFDCGYSGVKLTGKYCDDPAKALFVAQKYHILIEM